jgi:hypothetical protein
LIIKTHYKGDDFLIFKKIAASILAISLLFAACGCAENSELPGESVADTSLIQSVEASGVNTETSDGTTQGTTEETTVVTEFKTIPPPEDGWTLELLNEVTYINGKDIDLPFCVNDLGEDFSFGDVRYNSISNITFFNIYYKNKKAVSCEVANNIVSDFDDYYKITNIAVSPTMNESELDLSKFLVINGYNLSMNEDTAIKCLGNYYTKHVSNGLTYEIGPMDDYFFILFNPVESDNNLPNAKNTLILHLWSDDL